MWEIVATDNDGKRVRLTTADSRQELARMMWEESRDKENQKYKRIEAVRLWN